MLCTKLLRYLKIDSNKIKQLIKRKYHSDLVILFSNINAKAFNCDNSAPEYDASQCGKCKVAGGEVIKLTKGSKEIKNIDYLITWRASCSEKPPVGVPPQRPWPGVTRLLPLLASGATRFTLL